MRKTMPVARRVLGEGHDLTLADQVELRRSTMPRSLAQEARAHDARGLRAAVTTLEDGREDECSTISAACTR